MRPTTPGTSSRDPDLIRVMSQARFGSLPSSQHGLEPALEMAVVNGSAKIETAGWEGARILRPIGRRMWHTALGAADMLKTRDRTNYAPPAR